LSWRLRRFNLPALTSSRGRSESAPQGCLAIQLRRRLRGCTRSAARCFRFGMVKAEDENEAGQHEMKKDRDGMAEPAQFRPKKHSENVTQRHGAGIERAETHQKARPVWPLAGKNSSAAQDVHGYFRHENQHDQLDGEKDGIGNES